MKLSSELREQPRTPCSWGDDHVDSWKEIASFFRREVRTVQLWEKSEGLPVRRQGHLRKSSVYASRRELEAWWISRSVANTRGDKEEDASSSRTPTPSCRPNSTGGRLLVFSLEVTHPPHEQRLQRHNIDAFAHGIDDDLVLELRRLGLFPICPVLHSLTWPSKPTVALMQNMATEFESEFLLSGSVRYDATRLRVTLRLVRGTDLSCVWSDRFEVGLSRNASDYLDAQAGLGCRISKEISRHIGLLRASDAAMRNATVYNHSPAHHACKLGVHFWKQHRGAELAQAANCFRDAVSLDPTCAEAYAGLADTCIALSYSHLLPPREANLTTRHAVDTALALDSSSLAVQNASINFLLHCEWDWLAAEQVCRRIVDTGRGNARTLQLYGSLMINLGRHEEAISVALQAHALDSLSDLTHGQLSYAYFYAGDYANALGWVRRALALQPTYVMGHALLGRVQAACGKWDEAITALQNGIDIAPDSASLKALLAYSHAGRGDKAAARSILRDMEHNGASDCFPAYDVAGVHVMLGQEEQAMDLMTRAYEMRDIKTTYMQHDPRFAHLRGSTRFQDLAAAIYPGAGN